MAKKQQKKSYDLTKIIFSVSFLAVTLTALIFTLVICAKPFRITEVAHLKQVNIETYNTQNHDEYYVFVYGDDDTKNEWYSDLIIQYSNQARTTDTVLPIYGYDSSKKKQGALVSDTDNHLFLLNTLDSYNLTGKQAQQLLEEINVTTNKNMIPNDTLSPKETSGLRIGFAAVTTRGCSKEQAVTIANLIHEFLSNKITKEEAQKEVEKLVSNWKQIEEI